MAKCNDSAFCTIPFPPILPPPLFHRLYVNVNVNTSSQADDSPQAFPLPHDDGSQNLASQKAVLDTCRQGVETLVTQHCYLVMQSAPTHWKLITGMNTGQDKNRKVGIYEIYLTVQCTTSLQKLSKKITFSFVQVQWSVTCR